MKKNVTSFTLTLFPTGVTESFLSVCVSAQQRLEGRMRNDTLYYCYYYYGYDC